MSFEEKYEGKEIHDLGLAMVNLQKEHAEIKKQAAKVWKEVDFLRFIAIPTKMDNMSIQTVTLDDVGRISIRDELGVKMLDKPGLYGWLDGFGHADMISSSVNSSTLKAFIREQLKQGNEIPGSELVELKPYRVAAITKA